MLLQHGPELAPDAAAISPDWFTRSENREIYASVITGADVADATVAPELAAHLDALRAKKLRLSTPAKLERAWRQTSLAIEKEHLNNEVRQLSGLPEIMEDPDSPMLLRLSDSIHRIGEIDRLIKSAASDDA